MSRTDRPGPDPLDGGYPVLDFRRRFALWNNLSFWRQWAVGASLAAGALLALVVFDTPSAPGYVSVLRSADDDPAWLVSVNTAEGALSVRPVGTLRADEETYELWAIPNEGTPRSLGTVRASGETAFQLDIEHARRVVGAGALVIGPAGVSPMAAPDRRIYRGQLLPLAR